MSAVVGTILTEAFKMAIERYGIRTTLGLLFPLSVVPSLEAIIEREQAQVPVLAAIPDLDEEEDEEE